LLDDRTRRHGVQPARLIDDDIRPAPRLVPEPVDDITAGVAAAEYLAAVFDDIRPTLDAARLNILRAIGGWNDNDIDTQRLALAEIQRVVQTAIEETSRLRQDMHPELSERQLGELPINHGIHDPAANLAY